MKLGIEDKAFIVTGASSGIGAATARRLSEEGARVMMIARRQEALEQVAAGCRGAATFAVDVTAEDAAGQIVARCDEVFGRVDGLVNNAGGARLIPPDDLSDADWREQLDLNVMAPMRLIRAAAPRMAASGWGRIVNVCSVDSKMPELGNVPYSVAKAAELSLSTAMAKQWAGRGVLVNAVTPGVVETPAWLGPGGAAEQAAAAEGVTKEEVLSGLRGEVPTGRLGGAEEVAAVIALLCSDLAANIAGVAWDVDGGLLPTMY
jgi:NAD(P)-dependent dehydrogenase (short-subunit alcohol dehydrogenase family)